MKTARITLVSATVSAVALLVATSAAMAQGYVPAPPPVDIPAYSPAPPPGYSPVRPLPGGQPNFDALEDEPPSVALSAPGLPPLPTDPRFARQQDLPPYSDRPLPPMQSAPVYSAPVYSDRPVYAPPQQDQRVASGNPQDILRPPGGIDNANTGAVGNAPAAGPYSLLPPEERPEVGKVTLEPRLRRQEVAYNTKEPAGTIVVDTQNTYLYYVLGKGRAMRYGVRVGREGFTWNGAQKVSRKAEWPDWHPPAEMIERQPYLPRFMAGGDGNPMGARAMYLGATVYRIHGTNQPSTIGKFVSSGCIGMLNDDVADLYERVKVGTRVVVLPGQAPPNMAQAPAQPMPAQASNVPANGAPLPPLSPPVAVR